MTTVSLCMIVRNESAVIARCIQSVLPLISAWTVVDTGSTDNTPELVQRLLGHLPGQLHHRPWQNFAANRTEAFQLNRNLADYHLVIDADDWLEFSAGYRLPELDADLYALEVCHQGVRYCRPQIFRTALDWRYVGVVHEYAACEEARHNKLLKNVRYVCSSGQGARSANPRKFLDDAALLEAALLEEPDNCRYVFYLAQSYRDAGLWEEAAAAYRRRTEMGGWSEERYLSHLERARLLGKMNADFQEVRSELLQAYQINPERAEALTELAQLHRQRREWHLAHLFASTAAGLGLPRQGLFLEESIYAWRALDELALANFYTARFAEATAITQQLLCSRALPSVEHDRLQKNLQHCLANGV